MKLYKQLLYPAEILLFFQLSSAQPDSTFTPLAGGKYTVSHTDISNSEFKVVQMTDTKFNDVNMSGAAFHNANLSNIKISAAQLSGASFKHIGLPSGSKEMQLPITFEDADLNNLKIKHCDLSNATIDQCSTENMKIDGILVKDLLRAYREKQRAGN